MLQKSLILYAGPQTFRPKDAPRYVPAEATIIACYGVCLFILAFVHFYCVRQNKKKAQIRAAPGYVKLENQEYVMSTGERHGCMLTCDLDGLTLPIRRILSSFIRYNVFFFFLLRTYTL
jgi:hypothetical protein